MTINFTYNVDLHDDLLNEDPLSFPQFPDVQFQLSYHPDEHTHINDFDCYGKVEHGSHNDCGQVRPDGFDGSARIIRHDRHGSLWWQPYTGFEELTAEEQRNEQYRVEQLAEYGFQMAKITAYTVVEDGYGNKHTVDIDAEYLGGLDSDLDSDYAEDMIGQIMDRLHAAKEEAA